MNVLCYSMKRPFLPCAGKLSLMAKNISGCGSLVAASFFFRCSIFFLWHRAALVSVQFLLQRYKKCRNILDTDGGGGSVGGNVAVCTASCQNVPILFSGLGVFVHLTELGGLSLDLSIGQVFGVCLLKVLLRAHSNGPFQHFAVLFVYCFHLAISGD